MLTLQQGMTRSLYIHFPFCESRCHYCDFYAIGRNKTLPTDHTHFENALRQEVQLSTSALANELDTIFLGGGTPTMTSYQALSWALEPLLSRIRPNTEWTIEANPSSITFEGLRTYQNLGINRISIGIQALNPNLLQLLGRVHSSSQALQALNLVFESGLKNVSVDLLCGVPQQTLGDITDALEKLTSFPITHLSCYLLTLPPHHKMYPSLPNEETQLEHLLFIHDWMTSHGFEHYEISNFCKPGMRARHNLAYWKGQSYLGLGPSAHSYDSDTQTRWKNVSSLHQYGRLISSGALPTDTKETLTPAQIELEKWMLGLRLSEGFPETWLTTSLRQTRAKLFKEKGLLEDHPDTQSYLRLTAKGFALSDQVISALA